MSAFCQDSEIRTLLVTICKHNVSRLSEFLCRVLSQCCMIFFSFLSCAVFICNAIGTLNITVGFFVVSILKIRRKYLFHRISNTINVFAAHILFIVTPNYVNFFFFFLKEFRFLEITLYAFFFFFA